MSTLALLRQQEPRLPDHMRPSEEAMTRLLNSFSAMRMRVQVGEWRGHQESRERGVDGWMDCRIER